MTARRDFLAFTAGAVAARTVLPAAARAQEQSGPSDGGDHPDAPLIAACAAAIAVWDRIEAMPPGQEDAVWDAAGAEWHDAIKAVTFIRARTALGRKAKARILILEMQGSPPPAKGDQERLLAWRLAHDVLLGAV